VLDLSMIKIILNLVRFRIINRLLPMEVTEMKENPSLDCSTKSALKLSEV